MARGRQIGLTAERAEAGWASAGANPDGSTYRVIDLANSRDRTVYLTLPVPPAPAPLPAKLQIAGQMRLAQELRLAIFANGTYAELGTFGTPGGPEDGDDGWGKRSFDLGEALSGTPKVTP